MAWEQWEEDIEGYNEGDEVLRRMDSAFDRSKSNNDEIYVENLLQAINNVGFRLDAGSMYAIDIRQQASRDYHNSALAQRVGRTTRNIC